MTTEERICPYCRQRWAGVFVSGWRFPVHYVGRRNRRCPSSSSKPSQYNWFDRVTAWTWRFRL
jgi:RNA polymerase subunit RPABC4/transcription elongation factor Spt4